LQRRIDQKGLEEIAGLELCLGVDVPNLLSRRRAQPLARQGLSAKSVVRRSHERGNFRRGGHERKRTGRRGDGESRSLESRWSGLRHGRSGRQGAAAVVHRNSRSHLHPEGSRHGRSHRTKPKSPDDVQNVLEAEATGAAPRGTVTRRRAARPRRMASTRWRGPSHWQLLRRGGRCCSCDAMVSRKPFMRTMRASRASRHKSLEAPDSGVSDRRSWGGGVSPLDPPS